MSRTKKNEIETSSTSEEITKKTPKKTIKSKPVKKETKKDSKPTTKKTVQYDISEDELSDIEVNDDDTISNIEPDTNDEILIGQETKNIQVIKPQRIKTDPTIPIGQLNMEQIFNYQIDWAVDTYNLPLKNKMLEVKREFTGKGIKPKPRKNNNVSRDQFVQQSQYKPQNRDYHQPRDNYQGRGSRTRGDVLDLDQRQGSGPMQYNGGSRGGYEQRGGYRGGRGGSNNNRRLPQQDSEPDVYADN